MTVNKSALKQYLQSVEIKVNGKVLYRTPAVD
jgi:hypothetical protein